jgi:hypothetical protein
MATGSLTLLDIAARSGSDAVVGLIEEVTTLAPEFQVVPAMTKRGITYKLTQRTALPTAAFRDVNGATTIAKSTYTQSVKEMYYLDVPLQVDEAIVKADDGTVGDILANEASGALQAATIAIGSQFYYGTSADAKGYAGLLAQSVGKWPTGGTTNSTSAYLVWLNDMGVSFVVGRDGEIALPPWTRQAIISGSGQSATQKMAWVSNLSSYIGLQVASASAVWRVSGITAAAPLTDARGAGLLSKVPIARRNGLRWFMNRTAAYTLQKSRASSGFVAATSGGAVTTELPGPAAAFANVPTELAGIPITLTDSLVDTETNAGTADTYATE